MGKKSKDKKKGKGAEKTLAKTEKKQSNKMKKELQALGEEDIESIVAQIEKEEKKRLQVTEATVDAPSRRVNFTFIAHPSKEQLVLYGGEYFNGKTTSIYNDLFFYNIPNNTWTVVKAPAGPPPRCGHQMVATSANKGQLWIFGGEYASPTQAQFYHYRDLWVYHMATKQWEKITAPNGPSARSGHRMVLLKKQLIVFGGFHDNLRDYKYFNDVYSFDTESYKWTKLEPIGTPPTPRSGCCMAALNEGKVLVFGGVQQGKENDTTGTKFKWVQVKLGGVHYSSRCSMPLTTTVNNLSGYCYGGVFDVENDEEDIRGNFFDDFYQLDLEKLIWKTVTLAGNKEKDLKSRRRKNKDDIDVQDDGYKMEVEDIKEKVESTTISDDGIFKVTLGPAAASSVPAFACTSEVAAKVFQPSPRINSGLAIKHGVLYLYGGMYEDGDRQITFSDFYAVDLKKLDEWKTIIADDTSKMEWLGSDSEESEGGEESAEEEEEEEEESEDNSEEMQTD
ncbi:hypothetical protein NQ315_006277 [Exocentrus adspersus]|uniref:Kelch domain-containing protein 4 n=1 Tax=Exocentrus adspersus TaxID=1586481 RepID=A0AAV8VZM2_9CUCU|nr:hypothetical protein NQ315_006277 [Exocentrus adspersus]